MEAGVVQWCWMLQAHRVGAITSLCRTPWGGLWTGTSRGWIRIWECSDPGAFNDAGEYALPMRELRRHGGARPHSGSVAHMICPAGGQARQPRLVQAITLNIVHPGPLHGCFILMDFYMHLTLQRQCKAHDLPSWQPGQSCLIRIDPSRLPCTPALSLSPVSSAQMKIWWQQTSA